MLPMTWLVLLGLVGVVVGLPLLFATLRAPVRGGLLLGYLGLLQVIPGTVVAPFTIPLPGGLALTPANILVAGVLLTVVLIVVVEHDPVLVRLSVLVVLVAGALEVGLVALTGWAMSSGAVVPFEGAEAATYGGSLMVLLAGTPVVMAEVLAAVVVSERVRRGVPRRWAAATAGAVTLTALLVLDGVAFTVLTDLLEPGLARAVAGGVGRKLVLAVLFGVPLATYLAVRREPARSGRPLRLRDVVTIARGDLLERVARHERERIALLERTVTVAEEERQRLAEDLHDDAIQLFAAADLHLQRLQAREHVTELETVQRLVRNGVGSLRRIILQLRGPDVTGATFAPLVRTYVDRLQPDGDTLEVELDVDLPDGLPDETVAAAYRVVVEALSNVVRHARATRVTVEVDVRAGVLRGAVHDDGVGIPDDAQTGPGHLGLRAMRDRAEARGGELKVAAADGGTVVTFTLPVAPGSDGFSAARLAAPRR